MGGLRGSASIKRSVEGTGVDENSEITGNLGL